MSSTESELAKTFNADVVERFAHRFVDLLLNNITLDESVARVLDLACGTGYGTLPLFEALPEASTIVALSDERFALKEFHKQLTPEMRGRIFPHKESLKRLPLADGIFDLVCACLPCKLWEPLRPVIREALRVLRIGGQLAICVPLSGSFLELQGALGSSGEDDEQLAMQRMMAEITQLADADEWIKMIERGGGGDVVVKRETFKLTVEPPASKDRLIARHVLPLWHGEQWSEKTDETLDAAIEEPLETTVHIGCIMAVRVEEEESDG